MPGSMLSAPCIQPVTFVIKRVFQKKKKKILHYFHLLKDEETKVEGD